MNNPISISYPIKRGNNGYFEQTYSTSETIKNALANLILTPKKTRPGRPEYGCSIYSFLFEQITDTMMIEDILREDIKTWIPSIELISIASKNENFSNSISLKIIYKLKNTPQLDELSLTVSF